MPDVIGVDVLRASRQNEHLGDGAAVATGMSSISGPSGYCFRNVEVPFFLLAVALSIAFLDYFFTAPRYTFYVTSWDLPYLVIFVWLVGRFIGKPRNISGSRDLQDL